MAEHHFTLQRKMPGIVPVEIWFMNRGRIQKNSTNQKFIMLLGGMLMYALPALNPPFFPWDLWALISTISTISSTMIFYLNSWTAGEKIFWEAWSSESAAGCCSWRQLPRQHAVDRASLRRALWRSAARHALCAAASGVSGGCLRSNRARDQWEQFKDFNDGSCVWRKHGENTLVRNHDLTMPSGTIKFHEVLSISWSMCSLSRQKLIPRENTLVTCQEHSAGFGSPNWVQEQCSHAWIACHALAGMGWSWAESSHDAWHILEEKHEKPFALSWNVREFSLDWMWMQIMQTVICRILFWPHQSFWKHKSPGQNKWRSI